MLLCRDYLYFPFHFHLAMVRRKHRYLVCKVEFADGRRAHRKLNNSEVYGQVKNAIIKAHGEYGIGVVLSYLKVNFLSRPNILIIRGPRDHYRLIQSAMFFVQKIGECEAVVRTLHVGGTIRTCQKFYLDFMRKELPSLLLECKTKEEREEVQQAIASCGNLGYSKAPTFTQPFTQPYEHTGNTQGNQHSANILLSTNVKAENGFNLPYPFPDSTQAPDLFALDDIDSEEEERLPQSDVLLPGPIVSHRQGAPGNSVNIVDRLQGPLPGNNISLASQRDINPRKRQLIENGCDVCNIQYKSENEKKNHLASKKHAKRMKMAEASLDVARGPTVNKQRKEMNMTKQIPENGCGLCNVQYKSENEKVIHLASKKHKKKSQMSEGAGDVTKEPTKRNESTAGKSQEYYCTVCNRAMNSKDQFDQHCQSKKHKRKAKEQGNSDQGNDRDGDGIS